MFPTCAWALEHQVTPRGSHTGFQESQPGLSTLSVNRGPPPPAAEPSGCSPVWAVSDCRWCYLLVPSCGFEGGLLAGGDWPGPRLWNRQRWSPWRFQSVKALHPRLFFLEANPEKWKGGINKMKQKYHRGGATLQESPLPIFKLLCWWVLKQEEWGKNVMEYLPGHLK